MSEAPMNSPESTHAGIAVGEQVLRQIVGWDLQAAFGCQIVSLKTDSGIDCYAIATDKAAELIDAMGVQLDAQIRAVLAGECGALH